MEYDTIRNNINSNKLTERILQKNINNTYKSNNYKTPNNENEQPNT